MLVIKVELWSAITGQKSEIARMVIDNTGGTTTEGDYRCRTMRGRDEHALHSSMISILTDKSKAQREGTVLKHKRLQLHVWNLVSKALKNMGYGTE